MLLDILLALSPIILILLIIFIWKKPLTIAAPITYVYTVFLALLVWRIFFSYILISALKGLLVAVDITIIIFGAIFFLQFLKETEILKSLDSYISSISRDRRIQAILLVWFFGSFIEGTAGFGTPAAIVAPLLVGLGFPALIAVAIALIGNSTAVPFGAVGTPIRIGLSGVNANMASVAFYTGLINLFAGIIVPLMIASVVVLSTTRKGKKFERIKEITPFALYSGIMLTIPYFLFTFLGQEFPSLLGPLVGMFIVGFTTKKGFLIPKNTLEFDSSIKKQKSIRPEKLLKSLSPYLILVLFLILGKVYLPSFTISLINNAPHTLNSFNPGFAFILAVFFSMFILKPKTKKPIIKNSAVYAIDILHKPFIAILFIVGLVQVMIFSGNNSIGIVGMIETLASIMKGSSIIFLSPLVGAFGAFMAGSATVSSILFGNFQYLAATNAGYSVAIILALHLVGAGIGNMIALTNIISAEATVKLHGKEAEIIKKNIIPFLIYLILVIIIGGILIWFI